MTNFQINNCKILVEELVKLQATVDNPVFDMERWVNPRLDRARTQKALHKRIMKVTDNPCGTAACLAGKAGLIPRLRRLGFKWDVLKGKHRRFFGGDAKANFQYGIYEGTNAVSAFFGCRTFTNVFMRTKIRTLNGALRVLRKHIREEEAYNVVNGESL